MKCAVISKKNFKIIIVLLIWLAVAAIILYFNLKTGSCFSEKKLPVYCVSTQEKKAALTFDCAWTDEGTDEILAVLKDNGIKCTFFFVGDFADRYPETIRKIINAGHEAGNHSMKHNNPVKLTFEEIVSDIEHCNRTIKDISGTEPSLYRAPSGAYDNKTIEAAAHLGMTAVQWNVDSLDWKNLSSAEIKKRVVSATVPGSIILLHTGKINTVSALPDIIKELKASGYSFSTVGELLMKEDSFIDRTGKQCSKKE